VITAANASAALDGRTRIHPPSESMPQVVHLGDTLRESELLEALRNGAIDAVARGEIGSLMLPGGTTHRHFPKLGLATHADDDRPPRLLR
jgi:hypothetical protein